MQRSARLGPETACNLQCVSHRRSHARLGTPTRFAFESRTSRDCPGRARNGTAPARPHGGEPHMRRTSLVALVAAAAIAALSGCSGGGADRGATADASGLAGLATPFTVPAGAQLKVRLTSNLSSEVAQVGDPWSGTLAAGLTVAQHEILPAGSPVHGAVTGAHPAAFGTRAMLDLTIQDITIAGATHMLNAGAEAILADLPGPRDAGQSYDRQPPVAKGGEVILPPGTELVFTVKERAPLR